MINTNQLPDLFNFADGAPVKTKGDWAKRRQECLDIVVNQEYGGMPPTPKSIDCQKLYLKQAKHGVIARQGSFRVICQSENDNNFAFTFQVIAPPSTKPCPVILTGDGCWRYPQEAVTQILSRGYCLAIFNRVEISPDLASNINPPKLEQVKKLGLHSKYVDGSYGVLSAWAWGYHRVIDALEKLQLDFLDLNKIIATGHSRGGKTALLAGATDDRIAITAPNNSGCGGAGCHRLGDPKAQKLKSILQAAPHWFDADLKQYIDNETKLPFDQHFLKAAIAPRILLTTEALGDYRANPLGSWITHKAAKEVYKFLNIEEKIAIYFRNGQHRQGPNDWQTLMDFADRQFFNKPLAYEFNNSLF